MRALRSVLLALTAALCVSCAIVPQPGVPVPAPAPPKPRPAGLPPGVPVPPETPKPLQLDREPTIDVGLAWDMDSLVLEPAAVTPVSGLPSGAEDSTSGAVRARLGVGGWDVRLGGSSRRMGPTDTLWVGRDEGSDRSRTRWNGKTWRGRFKVFLNPRGRLTAALRLPLEAYLIGVVPGEIGPLAAGLIQAGRAQAIAARSYTLFYMARRADEGFDLYGTVEDQLYSPVESERPLATRCVESTRGQVALFDNRPIRANYSSTCGGITSDVWEAWPAAPLGYLVSHRDQTAGRDHCATSPHYRWREEWTVGEFTANVERFAPTFGIALPKGGLGGLVDVRAETRSRSGRVWRLVVSTTAGDVIVPAYSLRQVLRRPGRPEAILRSNLFKVDVRRDPTTRRPVAIVASGAGSGHGVGLCQTGALGMARAGASGERIVWHYYPGSEIRRLYP